MLARTKSDELTRILEKVFRTLRPACQSICGIQGGKNREVQGRGTIFLSPAGWRKLQPGYTGNKGYRNGGECPAASGNAGRAKRERAQREGAQKAGWLIPHMKLILQALQRLQKRSQDKSQRWRRAFEGRDNYVPARCAGGQKVYGQKSGGFGRGKNKFKGDGDFSSPRSAPIIGCDLWPGF